MRGYPLFTSGWVFSLLKRFDQGVDNNNLKYMNVDSGEGMFKGRTMRARGREHEKLSNVQTRIFHSIKGSGQ